MSCNNGRTATHNQQSTRPTSVFHDATNSLGNQPTRQPPPSQPNNQAASRPANKPKDLIHKKQACHQMNQRELFVHFIAKVCVKFVCVYCIPIDSTTGFGVAIGRLAGWLSGKDWLVLGFVGWLACWMVVFGLVLVGWLAARLLVG